MTMIKSSSLLLCAAVIFATPLWAQTETVPAGPSPAVVPAPAVNPVPIPPAPVVVSPPVKVIAPTPVKPTPVKPAKKSGPGDALKPGQYIWEKRAAYKNPLKIIAILDFQRLYVFDGEELVGFTTISSGKKGHETPTGVFTILQKEAEHYSSIYESAPMPFMQRLTWDGIALHAGKIPGVPASHGCIRMPMAFAKSLFGVTKLDQQVIVLKDTSKASQPSEPPKEEPKVVDEPKVTDPKPETSKIPASTVQAPAAPIT